MHIPDEELISAYLDDELSADDRLRAEQLLVERPDLRRLLDELRGVRDGLQALPKYSLGDEFSGDVLRRAEREVLRGDDVASYPTTSYQTVAAPSVRPAETATAPVALPSDQELPAARWRRSAIWSLTAVAAALVLMFVEQNLRRPDRDIAFKPADDRPAPVEEKPIEEKFAAEKAAGEGALRKDAAVGHGDGLNREVAKKENAGGLGGANRGGIAAPTDGVNDLNEVSTADMPATPGESVAPATAAPEPNAIAAKVAISAGRAPGMPLGQGGGAFGGQVQLNLGGQTQIDFTQSAATGDVRQLVADADSRRALLIYDNYRSLRQAAPDGDVAPKELQSQIALVDQNREGDAFSAGGAQAGDLAADVRQQGRAYDQSQATNNRGLVVITADITKDALPKLITPVLLRERFADLTDSWQFGDATSNVPGPAVAKSAAGQSAQVAAAADEASGGEKLKPQVSQDDGLKVRGKLSEQSALADDRHDADEEFFYVVAPQEKLEATLSTLCAEPRYVLNLHVEPAEVSPIESQRLTQYIRSGRGDSRQAGALRASGARPLPAASPSSAPAAIAAESSIAQNEPRGEGLSQATLGDSPTSYAATPSQAAQMATSAPASPSESPQVEFSSRAQRMTTAQVAEVRKRSLGERITSQQFQASQDKNQAGPTAIAKAKETPTKPAAAKGTDMPPIATTISPPASPAAPVPGPTQTPASSNIAPAPVATSNSLLGGIGMNSLPPAAADGATALRSAKQSSQTDRDEARLELGQTAPALPENYREAVFIFRIVENPSSSEAADGIAGETGAKAAETLAPAAAPVSKAAPMSKAAEPAKPAASSAPRKKS